MRTIPFRDVLWGVAYKLGLDPLQGNFQTDQAIPIGTYIDFAVGDTYMDRDWTEWTLLHQFIPDSNHIVSWDTEAIDVTPNVTYKIGRVLAVYLVDPRTTSAPIETEKTLNDVGIHVGFNHGSSVWIKFIEPAPNFTAQSWQPGTTFGKDAVTYSEKTGECYRSVSGSNRGHDPGNLLGGDLSAVITQAYAPGSPPSPGLNKIMAIDYTAAVNVSLLVSSQIIINDPAVIANVIHTKTVGETIADIITDLRNQLLAVLPVDWTVSLDTDPDSMMIRIYHLSDFLATATSVFSGPGIHNVQPLVSQTQAFIPPIPQGPITRQLTEITIGSSQVVQGATYTVIIRDSAGVEHPVSYVALPTDDGVAIILGLIQEIQDAVAFDAFFLGVYTSIDVASVKLILSTGERVSVSASYVGDFSPWWVHVPFPLALSDEVIDKAYIEVLKEWGQADKAIAEQQLTQGDQEQSAQRMASMPVRPLTGQQQRASRYKL